MPTRFRNFRLCSGMVLALGVWFMTTALFAARQARADEPSAADHQMMDMGEHAKMPAGIHGGELVGAGKYAFSYTPMFMHMENNYIGSTQVSPQTIVTTVPSTTVMMGMPVMYRVVPTSMNVQSHMFNLMYGVSDNVNLMVMASYLRKSMDMTTFSGTSGTTVLGDSSSTTEGVGDTSISALWRVYREPSGALNLRLGLSLPTGSVTQNITMLSPMLNGMMPMYMTMRGSYGMQLGTGTYDLLPGLTWTGNSGNWSWGAVWRGRFALGNNSEGYHYGDLNEVSGWGGYTPTPGYTYSLRLAESVQGSIHGADPMISGLMQGTNPNFYGGTHTDLLGGIEISGSALGLEHKHLSFEAGKTVIQNLNGPQLGGSWIFNASLGIGF
jgi:hypothetical protein